MTLIDRYDALVARGDLTRDAAQVAALIPLQTLLDKVSAPAETKGWFKRKKAPQPPFGCYLWGGVGRGKSMLMDLMHEMALERTVRSRRVHFHAFMQEIHEGMHEARAQGARDALAPVADRVVADLQLLCFDEMQITDITDAMIVGRLFERLFAGGVHVVTTSNRVPTDLYKDGLNRALFLPFISMIEDQMLVHELAAETDYRQDRLTGEPVYFTPGETTDMTLQDLWAKLSNGRSDGLSLKIKGRELHLPDYASGVARARFEDLCGKPLGAADYLALAQAVRVLILTHVPKLGDRHHNEARRFVTLVDALYEARTKVIISAEAEPEALYDKGAGRFEFDRTASRLREMQSEEWDGAQPA